MIIFHGKKPRAVGSFETSFFDGGSARWIVVGNLVHSIFFDGRSARGGTSAIVIGAKQAAIVAVEETEKSRVLICPASVRMSRRSIVFPSAAADQKLNLYYVAYSRKKNADIWGHAFDPAVPATAIFNGKQWIGTITTESIDYDLDRGFL